MTDDPRLTLEWLPGRYAACRLAGDAPLPRWALDAFERAGPSSARSIAVESQPQPGEHDPARLVCITRTGSELAIVIDESHLPPLLDQDTPIQRGFVALRIAGTLEFSMVGVLSKLTGALAEANISVFVLSTYDTDIILLREHDAVRAAEAVRPVADLAQKKGSGPAS